MKVSGVCLESLGPHCSEGLCLYSVFKAQVNHKRVILAINVYFYWDLGTKSLLNYVLLSQSFPLIEKRETGDDPWLCHCIDNHFLATWQIIIYGKKSEKLSYSQWV